MLLFALLHKQQLQTCDLIQCLLQSINFGTNFLSVRPLFCGESEVDQLGKIFEWVKRKNSLHHIYITIWFIYYTYFTENSVLFQSYWPATRGWVADWRNTLKKTFPPSLTSPNHWLCSRDKWAGGATIAGKTSPWIKIKAWVHPSWKVIHFQLYIELKSGQ